MSAAEITAMCAEFEEMCLSFIGIKREKEACEPIYIGEDAGWMDLFQYYDDGDCILEAAELSKMCAEMAEACRAFIKSSKKSCSPVYLSDKVGWSDAFANYTKGSCSLDHHELQAMCHGAKAECRAFGNFSSCEPVYLGDGIGFLDVFSASTSNATNGTGCAINMYKLSTACVNYPTQCTAFLRSGQCAPVWLGSKRGGYKDVYTYDTTNKTCRLSATKLDQACKSDKGGTASCATLLSNAGCPAGWRDHDKSIETACLPCRSGQFSPSRATTCTNCNKGWADTDKNPATPCQRCANGTTSASGATQCTKVMDFCRPINLGPNVGKQRVFKWDAKAGSCAIQQDLLYAACGETYYDECLAFLGNMNRKCDPVYLGDDIGWVGVFKWDAKTESCRLDHGELGAVCKENQKECVTFLRSNDKRECDPVYLGPSLGWAKVQLKRKGSNGKCETDQAQMKKLCKDKYSECQQYAEGQGKKKKGHECQPLYLGDAVGFANVFTLSKDTCQLDSKELESVCQEHEKDCHALLQSQSTQG
jgi:hypothetical protein